MKKLLELSSDIKSAIVNAVLWSVEFIALMGLAGFVIVMAWSLMTTQGW